MIIQEEFLKCVAFICEERTDGGVSERLPVATCFLVQVPLPRQGRVAVYAVTARHVIDCAEGQQWIRVNTTAGGFVDIPCSVDDWYTHDSEDVAIVPAPLFGTRPAIDWRVIPLSFFVSDDCRYKGPPLVPDFVEKTGGMPVQLGLDLFFTGLFVQHAGRKRNLPIVRFGSISRMPQERVRVKECGETVYETLAYLAEVHSWGGHSGSPAFVAFPAGQWEETAKQKQIAIGYIKGLLGLVVAHFDIPTKGETTGDYGTVMTGINAGIAAIVPAEAIRQLLMREDIVEDRTKYDSKFDEREPAATADRTIQVEEAERGSLTKEGFEGALKRVSRRAKPVQPDEAPPET